MYENVIDPRLEMKRIKSMCTETELFAYGDKQDNLCYLDFLIETIKRDIKSGSILNAVFGDGQMPTDAITIPLEYEDEQGNHVRIATGETMSLDFKNAFVLTDVWSSSRLYNALRDIRKSGFLYDRKDHFAYYYSGLDIFHVRSGNHHAEAASYFKVGKMETEVYDVAKLFDHIETDGMDWYNSSSGKKIGTVIDFRVAILFELCKMKRTTS